MLLIYLIKLQDISFYYLVLNVLISVIRNMANFHSPVAGAQRTLQYWGGGKLIFRDIFPKKCHKNVKKTYKIEVIGGAGAPPAPPDATPLRSEINLSLDDPFLVNQRVVYFKLHKSYILFYLSLNTALITNNSLRFWPIKNRETGMNSQFIRKQQQIRSISEYIIVLWTHKHTHTLANKQTDGKVGLQSCMSQLKKHFLGHFCVTYRLTNKQTDGRKERCSYRAACRS